MSDRNQNKEEHLKVAKLLDQGKFYDQIYSNDQQQCSLVLKLENVGGDSLIHHFLHGTSRE